MGLRLRPAVIRLLLVLFSFFLSILTHFPPLHPHLSSVSQPAAHHSPAVSTPSSLVSSICLYSFPIKSFCSGGWYASRARKAASLASFMSWFLICHLWPEVSPYVLCIFQPHVTITCERISDTHILGGGDFPAPFCYVQWKPPLPCFHETESVDVGFRVSVGGISRMPINFLKFLYPF